MHRVILKKFLCLPMMKLRCSLLLPLGMALCNAFYQILTRKLSGIEHPMTSLFWGALVGTAMFSPFLGAAWMPPASGSTSSRIRSGSIAATPS